MQRDLVERARTGDHDAFAELAGAAISRWMALPGSSSGMRNRPRTPCRTRSSGPGVICPRSAIPTASTPGSTGSWSVPASMRRAGSDAIASMSNSPPLTAPAVDGAESVVVARDQLERGFLRLDPEMRAVIVLHHYLDLPLPTVAATLGIPLGTAKSRLHRALGLMRAALDADSRVGPDIRGGPSGMTTDDTFGQHLAGWLHEEAEHRVPTTSARSWCRPRRRDSGSGGRAPKGGFPWTPRLTCGAGSRPRARSSGWP